MDTDQNTQDDAEAAAATPAPKGLHPIKTLEALFKRHIIHTTELASHVEAGLGVASEASRQAVEAARQAGSLFQTFQKFADDVDKRFVEVEAKITALQPPAISPELETAAQDLEQAVTDVKAAVPASAAVADGTTQDQGKTQTD